MVPLNGAAAGRQLPQTSWTLLVAARDQGLEGQSAREEFASRYYRPVHAYLQAIVRDDEEAKDLTQGFFTDVIVSGRLLNLYDRAHGSFRPYLKQALRNYVTSALRARERAKRRPAEEEVRPDQWSSGWANLDLGVQAEPEVAFHEAWVRDRLREALARVKEICEVRHQSEHLALFLGRYLSEAPEPPSWNELGAPFGLDGKTARSRADTVAAHFRAVLRQMLKEEVGSGQSPDDEISNLLALF